MYVRLVNNQAENNLEMNCEQIGGFLSAIQIQGHTQNK